MQLRVLWVQSIAGVVVLTNTPEKPQKSVFVISWAYKRITCIWFKTSALLPLLGVLEPSILLLLHWKNFLGNGCLLLFGTFAILTDYCRNFLSRWASHWLTRELNEVTFKWPWGPRDSDSRATMWLLWVKKTTVSTNWHQFEPIFGWLREEGAEALKFTSLASSEDSAWFWLSTIWRTWLAKQLISPISFQFFDLGCLALHLWSACCVYQEKLVALSLYSCCSIWDVQSISLVL